MFGLLYARQSCANQPPGSDAVVVLLALARPTTEWHQHIQSRRFNPCVVAQISRGLTGMGARASGSHGRGRAVSLRPRRRGRPGMVPDVGLMSARSPGCFCGGVWVWVVSVSGMRKPLGACAPRASCTCDAAACCSPTPCRVQYHRRARPWLPGSEWDRASHLRPWPPPSSLIRSGTMSRRLWQPGNRTADADIDVFVLWPDNARPSGAVCRRKMRSNRRGLECWCCLSSVSTGRLHPSRGFHVRPIDHVFCMGTTGTRVPPECLSWSKARLDAFSGYPLQNVANRPCHWRDNRHTRGSSPRSSRTMGRPHSIPTSAEDRDQTVSRRSEPSSRAALIGEQPNPWDLLQPQDATSRHRGAKPSRRYGLLGMISLLSPGYLLSVERCRVRTPAPDH